MTEEQVNQIVAEVLKRLLPQLGADGSRGSVIVVFTGATVGTSETIIQLRSLILGGYDLKLVFSEMADHLYGSWVRDQLDGFPHWIQLPPVTWLKALREARAVVVPLMSVNTLSKLSLLIADSQTGNLILHGLFMGRPVIIARNGFDNKEPGRAELGFNKGNSRLTRVIEERSKTIESYGCVVVDISRLSVQTDAALTSDNAQEDIGLRDVVENVGIQRNVVRHDGTLITAGDVLQAHLRGADLECVSKVLITPLARDLAAKYRVFIGRNERK
jgi:hypothetical protein